MAIILFRPLYVYFIYCVKSNTSKAIPIHCVVESQRIDCDVTSLSPTAPIVERDTYVIVPGNAPFVDIVRIALVRIGYSLVESLAARGYVELKNWKRLPVDVITDNCCATVEEVLGDLVPMATICIRLSNTNRVDHLLREVQDKMLTFLFSCCPTLFACAGCPITDKQLSDIARGDCTNSSVSANQLQAFLNWYSAISTTGLTTRNRHHGDSLFSFACDANGNGVKMSPRSQSSTYCDRRSDHVTVMNDNSNSCSDVPHRSVDDCYTLSMVSNRHSRSLENPHTAASPKRWFFHGSSQTLAEKALNRIARSPSRHTWSDVAYDDESKKEPMLRSRSSSGSRSISEGRSVSDDDSGSNEKKQCRKHRSYQRRLSMTLSRPLRSQGCFSFDGEADCSKCSEKRVKGVRPDAVTNVSPSAADGTESPTSSSRHTPSCYCQRSQQIKKCGSGSSDGAQSPSARVCRRLHVSDDIISRRVIEDSQTHSKNVSTFQLNKHDKPSCIDNDMTSTELRANNDPFSRHRCTSPTSSRPRVSRTSDNAGIACTLTSSPAVSGCMQEKSDVTVTRASCVTSTAVRSAQSSSSAGLLYRTPSPALDCLPPPAELIHQLREQQALRLAAVSRAIQHQLRFFHGQQHTDGSTIVADQVCGTSAAAAATAAAAAALYYRQHHHHHQPIESSIVPTGYSSSMAAAVSGSVRLQLGPSTTGTTAASAINLADAAAVAALRHGGAGGGVACDIGMQQPHLSPAVVAAAASHHRSTGFFSDLHALGAVTSGRISPTNSDNSIENTSGCGGSNGMDRRKRSRVFIDPLTEIPRLERWFADDTHPSAYTIEQYTNELNAASYRQRFPPLEPKNVQLWFKNHRAKVKRQKLEMQSAVAVQAACIGVGNGPHGLADLKLVDSSNWQTTANHGGIDT